MSSIVRPIDLKDQDYHLEEFYLETDAPDPHIAVSKVVESMNKTTIKNQLTKVNINGRDYPDILELLQN